MDNKDNLNTSETTRANANRRRRRIQNVKTGGDIMMYIGAAGLVAPFVRSAKEKQSPLLQSCVTGAGIILSIALGNFAGKSFEKTVDRIVDFWDDVKPSGQAKKTPTTTEPEGEKENG